MLGKVLATVTLCAFVLLSALMQSTTPSTIHPIGILLVFVLLYVLALGVLTFFLYAASRAISQFQALPFGKSPLTLRRAYIYASIVALAPVMLLGTASIGRLGIYEILLTMVFEAIACFYVSRRR